MHVGGGIGRVFAWVLVGIGGYWGYWELLATKSGQQTAGHEAPHPRNSTRSISANSAARGIGGGPLHGIIILIGGSGTLAAGSWAVTRITISRILRRQRFHQYGIPCRRRQRPPRSHPLLSVGCFSSIACACCVSVVCLLSHACVPTFVRTFVCSFVRLFVRPSVRSFVLLCVRAK